MSQESVLGYINKGRGQWEPIEEIPRGYIVTAAFVMCCNCLAPIRSNGGPIYRAWCLKCYEEKNNESTD